MNYSIDVHTMDDVNKNWYRTVTYEIVPQIYQKYKLNDRTLSMFDKQWYRFDKQWYRTMSYNPENVPDIYQKYLKNVCFRLWISAPVHVMSQLSKQFHLNVTLKNVYISFDKTSVCYK